jgi:hypothetical protein
MQELAKVELAGVLTHVSEAVGDLCGAQGVLFSQLTLDLATQDLARSRQVA